MQAVFDRTGHIVGWMEADVIYDLHPKARAFVHDGGIFTFSGEHLGYYRNGVLLDRRSAPVAFLRGAHPGPEVHIPPVPPAPKPPATPKRPVVPKTPPAAPKPKGNWSPIPWKAFLAGEYEGSSYLDAPVQAVDTEVNEDAVRRLDEALSHELTLRFMDEDEAEE